MTINTQTGISDVMLGDGTNRVFPFDFKIGSIVEVVAYADGVLVSSASYTVDLADDWTGDVVFATAPADGVEIVLASSPVFAQSSVHQRQGPFFADVVEDDLDRATLRDIFLKREVDRSIKASLFTDMAGFQDTIVGVDENGDAVAGPSLSLIQTLAVGALPAIAPAQTVVANIAALVALPRAGLADGVTAFAQGFYASNDGGQGNFVWRAASTSTPIAGYILAIDGSAGRWVRIHDGSISARQCGARYDGTDDGAALQAMAAVVTANPLIRKWIFDAGDFRLLVDAPFKTADLTSIHDLIVEHRGTVFKLAVDQTTTAANVAVVDMYNCLRTKFIGAAKVEAEIPFTKAYMIANGVIAGKGSLLYQFHGNCSGSDIDIDAYGTLMPANWIRAPRLTMHPRRVPRIIAGGTGYAVNDIITLTNLGSPSAGLTINATTAATFKVLTVSGGAITSLEHVNRGEWAYNYDIGLRIADTTGYPTTTSGAGTGARIVPFLADLDDELNKDVTRNCNIKIKARYCYYGFHANFNVADSDIVVDTDYVYRDVVHYGADGFNDVWVRARNHVGDGVTPTSVLGLGCKMNLYYTQLPTIQADGTPETTFNTSSSCIRVAYLHKLPGEVVVNAVFDIDVPTNANYFGSVFEVEKFAISGSQLQATDASPGVGQIGRFSFDGLVRGIGRLNSGLGANGLFGTNVDTTNANWTGCELHWVLKDTFVHVGRGNSFFNAKGLGSLTIGSINSDGAIATDFAASSGVTADALTPTGPVIFDPAARFRNRFIPSAYFPTQGDIQLSGNCTIGANLRGHRFHMGAGVAGTTDVAIWTPSVGDTFEIGAGATTGGQVHVFPPNSFVLDGATSSFQKKIRLETLNSRVKLECFQASRWSITYKQGTVTIEP